MWQFVEKTRAYNRAVAAQQEQSRLRQQAQNEAAKSQQVARFFQETLQGAGPEVANGRDATILLESLDLTAERIGRELTNQLALEADVRITLGRKVSSDPARVGGLRSAPILPLAAPQRFFFRPGWLSQQ